MKYLVVLFLAALTLTLIGCSDEGLSPSPPEQNSIVAQDVPADVQNLLDKYTWPEGAPIPLANLAPAEGDNDPAVSVLDGYDVYAVTILWGHLFNLSPPPQVTTDWSGTLWVNGVAIVNVRETIDFEPGEDSVLQSMGSYYAEWRSFTTDDLDGLSFLVYLKRGIIYIVPPVLTFDTPPFTMSWDFETLADFSAFYLVNNTSAVAIISEKIWPNVCPQGMISGEWIKTEIFADSGTFNGLWLDENGEPLGYLSGYFWKNSDGSREYAGSVSGYITDQVIAEVHGTWWYDDPRLCPLCGAGHGQFRGRYVYLNDGTGGSMWGEFGDYSLPLDELVMPLKGRWRDDCPTITPSDITVSDK